MHVPRPALVQAHSFVLQARLAISLAFVAGYTNAVALATCGVMVSHVTGHATALGRDTALGVASRASPDRAIGLAAEATAFGFVAALLAAFLCGAFLSGLATAFARLRGWPSIYVAPAALEIALLVAFALGVELHDPAGIEQGWVLWWMSIAASLAMGVQNATITSISHGVVRTTHLTGVLTDLGREFARAALVRRMLGGESSEGANAGSATRLLLLASLFGSFVLGGVLGTGAFLMIPHASMLPPILLLGWIILQDLRRPIAELEAVIHASRGDG